MFTATLEGNKDIIAVAQQAMQVYLLHTAR
jgi:hypothetical protein